MWWHGLPYLEGWNWRFEAMGMAGMVGMVVRGTCFFFFKGCTFRGTTIFSFEDTCPFPKVGYVSSLEGMFFFLLGDFFVVYMKQNWKQQMEIKINIEPAFDALQHDWALMKTWCLHTQLYNVCTRTRIGSIQAHEWRSRISWNLWICSKSKMSQWKHVEMLFMYVAASGPQNPYRKRLVGRITNVRGFFWQSQECPLRNTKNDSGFCQLTDWNIQVDSGKFGEYVNM